MTTKGADCGGGGGGAGEGNQGVLRCARRRRRAFSGRSVRGGPAGLARPGAGLPPACRVPGPPLGGGSAGREGRARGAAAGGLRCGARTVGEPRRRKLGAPGKVGGEGMRRSAGPSALEPDAWWFLRLRFQLRDLGGSGRPTRRGGSLGPGASPPGRNLARPEAVAVRPRPSEVVDDEEGCPSSSFKHLSENTALFRF